MISYYELLKKIEKGDIPEKIKVHLTSKTRVYKADYDGSDFSHYFIYDGEADDDYHYYLAECFLESDMFDKNIEIIEEEKKIPERLNKSYNIIKLDLDKPYKIKDYDMEQLLEMVQDIYEKQGEIIDYLQSKGE